MSTFMPHLIGAFISANRNTLVPDELGREAEGPCGGVGLRPCVLAWLLAQDKRAALRIHAHICQHIFLGGAWTFGATPCSGGG
jgi:hypothetical protein